MSTISVYFIPVNKLTCGNFKPRAVEILESLGVINGYYDESEEGFASGETILFEYATIYDGPAKRLVPEASTDGYGAMCSHCQQEIDELFYNTISDFYDEHGEAAEQMDMSTLELTCANCNTTLTLEALKYNYRAAFETQFFQLTDIEGEISPAFLHKLQQQFGTPFQVIYERM